MCACGAGPAPRVHAVKVKVQRSRPGASCASAELGLGFVLGCENVVDWDQSGRKIFFGIFEGDLPVLPKGRKCGGQLRP